MSDRISGKHRAVLSWFELNAGCVTDWPGALPDGTLLATKAKGIYKPSWSSYAISVRQSIGAPYPDGDPIAGTGGAWSFRYFQEGLDPNDRDKHYTNLGLMRCMHDGIPVGVFRQKTGKPAPSYEVLGLGLVEAWEQGFFLLRSCRGV